MSKSRLERQMYNMLFNAAEYAKCIKMTQNEDIVDKALWYAKAWQLHWEFMGMYKSYKIAYDDDVMIIHPEVYNIANKVGL